VKNSLRQPTQIQRADSPVTEKPVQPKQPAKVVSIVGLRISEPKRTLSQIYDRGLFRYTEGKFDDACLDFKQASQDPQLQTSCVLMASRCYRRTGSPEKAIALLKTALGRNGCPDDDAVKFRRELARFQPAENPQSRVASPQPAEKERVTTEQVTTSAPEMAVQAASSPKVDLYAAPIRKWITVPFGLAVTVLVVFGFLMRGEQHLTAESGLGYILGIIGSLLMLVLMLYPLRKKARFMRNWGSIPHWFRFHMMAGIIGPVMVLFHANFQLGSLNSKVVLGSTLLVAGSGIFGRYLYTKIHYGLYGKRASLEQLHDLISNNQDNLAAVFVYAPKIQQRLLSFDEAVLKPSSGVLQSIGRVFMIDFRRRWTQVRITLVLRRALKVTARRNQWSRREKTRQFRAANRLISKHLTAVLKVAEFSFYERFFSLWHILHMPLFLLLVIALLMHVVAVHMY